MSKRDKKDDWRDAIGCAPAIPGSISAEEAVRRCRDGKHVQWPLSLSPGMGGSVDRFHDQVVLRVFGPRQGLSDSREYANFAFSRAEAIHLASRLREAAMHSFDDAKTS